MANHPSDGREPDPSNVRSVQQLAEALRQLRMLAGSPSYREIEGRARNLLSSVPLPRSTVSDALAGRRRPSLDVVRALVRVLGVGAGDVAAWEGAWRRAAEGGPFTGHVWSYRDKQPVTIVCSRLPRQLRELIGPYADPSHPDYIELYTYADLDALFELYGHLRTVSPANEVRVRAPSDLTGDDYTTHLVVIGGVDWNEATANLLNVLDVPVRQIRRIGNDTAGFEVTENGKTCRFEPVLPDASSGLELVEDVVHFFRGANPYNRRVTVTLCNGMFSRGTYGAVRALTDPRFRDRNDGYVRSRFGRSEQFSILARMKIVNGRAVTPDWTDSSMRLHEWPQDGA